MLEDLGVWWRTRSVLFFSFYVFVVFISISTAGFFQPILLTKIEVRTAQTIVFHEVNLLKLHHVSFQEH